MNVIEHGADCTECDWQHRGERSTQRAIMHFAIHGHEVKIWAQTLIPAAHTPTDLPGRSPVDLSE